MRQLAAILSTALFLVSANVHASEGAKEGGASPYAKLETFTVNLKGLDHFLQVNIALKVANPKISDTIKAWSPVVRHETILLLSDQSGSELATLPGKHKVMEAIKTSINKVIKLDDKEGVTDVLFESFVIQ